MIVNYTIKYNFIGQLCMYSSYNNPYYELLQTKRNKYLNYSQFEGMAKVKKTINKLNEENQYLADNMEIILRENRKLRRELDNTYTHTNYSQRLKTDQSTKKTRVRTQASPEKNYNSDNKNSVLKSKTIIGDLDDDRFNSSKSQSKFRSTHEYMREPVINEPFHTPKFSTHKPLNNPQRQTYTVINKSVKPKINISYKSPPRQTNRRSPTKLTVTQMSTLAKNPGLRYHI